MDKLFATIYHINNQTLHKKEYAIIYIGGLYNSSIVKLYSTTLTDFHV